MADSYRQLKARINDLQTQAESVRRDELRVLLVQMRRDIREYGITPEQLFGPDLSDLVKYRDPESGKAWNGLGRPPNWIRGKDRERFRVS